MPYGCHIGTRELPPFQTVVLARRYLLGACDRIKSHSTLASDLASVSHNSTTIAPTTVPLQPPCALHGNCCGPDTLGMSGVL